MPMIIDLTAELGKLTTLRGRTPQTTNAERAGTAAELGAYRDGALFASKFAGVGAWERHPNGEELVHIIEGMATLDIVTADLSQSVEVGAGMLVVVPRDAWHRFRSPNGLTLMTATPRPSEHVRLDVDDPRAFEAPRG